MIDFWSGSSVVYGYFAVYFFVVADPQASSDKAIFKWSVEVEKKNGSNQVCVINFYDL